jgi:hypothetical protein
VPADLAETDQTVSKALNTARTYQADFQQITGMHGGGPGGAVVLNEVALRTQPVETILERINQVYDADVAAGAPAPRGWPAAQNSNRDLRTRVVHAMTEARAQEVTPTVAFPGPEYTVLTNAAGTPGAPGWEITDYQLLTLPTPQILQLITARATSPVYAGAAGAGVPTAGNIDLAREVAQQRLRGRAEGAARMETFARIQVHAAETAAGGVSVADLRRMKERAKALATTQKENVVSKEAFEFALEPNRFFDPNPVNPADPTLLPPERATYEYTPPPPAGGVAVPVVRQYPRGYLELMDKVFNTRKDNSFQDIIRVLPPQEVARIVDETVTVRMRTALGAPASDDIEVVLNSVAILLRNNQVGWAEVQNGINALRTRYIDQAAAAA